MASVMHGDIQEVENPSPRVEAPAVSTVSPHRAHSHPPAWERGAEDRRASGERPV